MKSRRNKLAYTLIELMIVVLVISIVLEIALPSFIATRTHTQISKCTSDLQHIDGAKQQYALDQGLQAGQAVNNQAALVPRYLEFWPKGATGGSYEANAISTPPTYNGQDLDWYMVHCVNTLDSSCPF